MLGLLEGNQLNQPLAAQIGSSPCHLRTTLWKPPERHVSNGDEVVAGGFWGFGGNQKHLVFWFTLKLTASLHPKMDGEGRLSRFHFGFRCIFQGRSAVGP